MDPTPQELGILFVMPGTYPFGTTGVSLAEDTGAVSAGRRRGHYRNDSRSLHRKSHESWSFCS